MYEAKLAKSQAKKDLVEVQMLQSNIKHREEVDRLKVENKNKLRDLIRRHAEEALLQKQQVKGLKFAPNNAYNMVKILNKLWMKDNTLQLKRSS